jgi:hypothetical protein
VKVALKLVGKRSHSGKRPVGNGFPARDCRFAAPVSEVFEGN